MKYTMDYEDFEREKSDLWMTVKWLYENCNITRMHTLNKDKRAWEKVAAAYLKDLVANNDDAILVIQRFNTELCDFVEQFNTDSKKLSEKLTLSKNLHQSILKSISDNKEFYEIVDEMFDALNEEHSFEAQKERENIARSRAAGIHYESGLPYAWAGAL